MDDEALENYARSMRLNAKTRTQTELLAQGVSPKTLGLHQEPDGWVLVGRYCAGKKSARVQATKIRHRHPTLETWVTDAPTSVEWQAELRVRIRHEDRD